MAQPAHVSLAAATQAQIVAGVFGAIALVALRGFFLRLKRDRLVADTPLSKIRSAAQGYVKVAGRAGPAGAAQTAAPLSSRPCIWWSYEIAHKETDSRGNSKWAVVDKAASAELFTLADDGGQCLVGPVQAEITPTINNTWYGATARPGSPPPASSGFLHIGDWRYTERLLSAGDRLSVMGELRSRSEVGNVAAAAAEKLRVWKQDQPALLARFDANRDGHIDAAEWEAVRAEAVHESEAEIIHSAIPRVSVISKPANGEPFLIAPLTTEGLERRERRFTLLYFAVGLLCVVLCGLTLKHAGTLAKSELTGLTAVDIDSHSRVGQR